MPWAAHTYIVVREIPSPPGQFPPIPALVRHLTWPVRQNSRATLKVVLAAHLFKSLIMQLCNSYLLTFLAMPVNRELTSCLAKNSTNNLE